MFEWIRRRFNQLLVWMGIKKANTYTVIPLDDDKEPSTNETQQAPSALSDFFTSKKRKPPNQRRSTSEVTAYTFEKYMEDREKEEKEKNKEEERAVEDNTAAELSEDEIKAKNFESKKAEILEAASILSKDYPKEKSLKEIPLILTPKVENVLIFLIPQKVYRLLAELGGFYDKNKKDKRIGALIGQVKEYHIMSEDGRLLLYLQNKQSSKQMEELKTEEKGPASSTLRNRGPGQSG